jgi:hypothetical protein
MILRSIRRSDNGAGVSVDQRHTVGRGMRVGEPDAQHEQPPLELRVPREEWSEETLAAAVAQLAPLFAVQLLEEPQLVEPLLGHVAIDLDLNDLEPLPAASWTAAVLAVLQACFWRSPRGAPTAVTLAFWNGERRRVARARLLTENVDQVSRALTLLPHQLTEDGRDIQLVFDARLRGWRQE